MHKKGTESEVIAYQVVQNWQTLYLEMRIGLDKDHGSGGHLTRGVAHLLADYTLFFDPLCMIHDARYDYRHIRVNISIRLWGNRAFC